MQILPPTIAGLLDVARELLELKRFDSKRADKILGQMPYAATLDAQTRGAIQHARLVVTAAHDGGQIAVARFALARVVVLLEKHVATAMSRSG